MLKYRTLNEDGQYCFDILEIWSALKCARCRVQHICPNKTEVQGIFLEVTKLILVKNRCR